MSLRKLVLILTLACLGLSPTGCDKPEEKAAKYIKRGNELFEQQEYAKARVEYRNAARIKPADPEVRYRLGLTSEAEGDYQNAFINFTYAEQQNARFRPALLKLAQYYLVGEQYDQTQKRLDIVLADAPDDPEAHALRAAVLLRQKDYAGTEKEALFALEKDPANVSAISALTGMYAAQKDETKAIAILDKGIAYNPSNISLFLMKAMLYEQFSNLEKTIETYQAILKLKPKEVRFRSDLASIYVKAGKTDEAEKWLRSGVAEFPDNWDMKKSLVSFLSENRDLDKAEKEIRVFMQTNPTNNELYFWLADLYIKHNATERAIELLQQLVAKDQFDTPGLTARTSLARIHFIKGNRELAERLVKSVLEKKPDNQEALYIRARLSFDQGHYRETVSDLRAIIRDNPKAKNAYQLLAETLLLQGHLDLAIDTLGQLIEIDPANTSARVRLAQMYGLNGDSKKALGMLNAVTKADPQYAIGWESTARIAIAAKSWLVAKGAIDVLETLEGQKLTAALLRGQTLSLNGKVEESIPFYTTVIDANPSAPLAEHALSSLVDAYQSLNQLQDGVNYLKSLKTDSLFVATLLGECLQKLGNTDEAVVLFDSAIARHAAFQEPYIDRARIYIREKKIETAIDILNRGKAAAPADPRAPMMLADVCTMAGRHQEAMAIYEEILTHNPDMDAAANNLAQAIADHQHTDAVALEKARRLAERFVRSDNPLLLDTLGWVYFRQGRYPQAQTIMERLLPQEKQWPPLIHYHYGSLLLKTDKKNDARMHLQQAVAEGANYVGLEEAKKLLQESGGP